MFCAMTFAALTGTVFPIVLHRLNIDPAVASGPFVSTGNDLSASLIYLLMCYLMLTA
jgi:magnesium transporter